MPNLRKPITPDEVPIDIRHLFNFDSQRSHRFPRGAKMWVIDRKCADCGNFAKCIPVANLRQQIEKGRIRKYCRHCAFKRERSPHWNNGIRANGNGYIRVVAPAGQHSANADGWILEHWLVMEQHLGRQLLPEESVHHINGKKDDNRIENLELWAGKHPRGQRIEDFDFADGSEDYFNLAYA